MKRALIIGIKGQDGTLLANRLSGQGVDLIGLSREGVLAADGSLLEKGHLTDPDFVQRVIASARPTHVYYLAAHHHSAQDIPLANESLLWKASLDVNVLGLVHTLDALRLHAPEARLFYAASSHIFGSNTGSLQDEKTPRVPDNIYGATKVMGMDVCGHYRRQYGLLASVGILYNHESIHRKEKFLSQKIIRGALDIKTGRSRQLVLGDLSAEVDWGYAPDYVDAITRILDLPEADEFVIATGESHSVREFVEVAFDHLGLNYRDWVSENPSIIRKQQKILRGDSTKLRQATNWQPSVSFPEMVRQLTEQTREILRDV